jgi:DNA-directed RNA polymerase sigma subunit (sigma70/sigma32)
MKITKSISYAINWLMFQNYNAEQIAEELKLTVQQVQKYIEKHSISKQLELPIKSSKVPSKSKELMIRHTRDKKINNVAIMTKEASEVNDEFKKQINNVQEKNLDHIFRPNE